MFYSFKNQLFAALLIVVAAIFFNFNAAKAACPTNPPGNWQSKDIVNTYITPEGCTVKITVTWCYAIINDLHYVSFSDIKMCVEGCDPKKINPESYYNTQTIDSSLISFSTDPRILRNFLEISGLPPCPGYLCYLQVYDAICYSGWYPNPDGCWKMQICDNDTLRRCAEEIHICADTVTGKVVVERIGTSTPPPCRDSVNCHYKCF